MPVDWIFRGQLVNDELDSMAVYPYVGLKNITALADCRSAIEDIGGRAYEQEFGVDTMTPYYNLLWTLNTTSGLCTSHTAFSTGEAEPDFSWAAHIFGSVTIILPRIESQQFELEASFVICRFLDNLITSGAKQARENTAGRRIVIRPVRMNHAHFPDSTGRTIGFGCQLIVSGNAGSRLRAAQRWSATVHMVLATLVKHNDVHGHVEPHEHPYIA